MVRFCLLALLQRFLEIVSLIKVISHIKCIVSTKTQQDPENQFLPQNRIQNVDSLSGFLRQV